jgi:hypothetical protein
MLGAPFFLQRLHLRNMLSACKPLDYFSRQGATHRHSKLTVDHGESHRRNDTGLRFTWQAYSKYGMFYIHLQFRDVTLTPPMRRLAFQDFRCSMSAIGSLLPRRS